MKTDDYVIVLKPHTTVALKTTFQQGELGAAISQLIGRQHMNAITISPNYEQNIIVCGTQNPEVVQKLLTDFQLNTSKGPLPLHGHLKLTGDVCREVISVHNLETSESLKDSVQWRGGELVHVRKLGNSNVAVLTFEGRNVPRYVLYNAELTPVREYKKTVLACYRCGTLGHRADNCPNPVNERCGLCSQNVWAVCGGPHAPHRLSQMHREIRQASAARAQDIGALRNIEAPARRRCQETPSRGVTSPPDKTAAATPLPGDAEFPALSAPSGGAARNQPKELRRELALLRAQNEKLASELNSLRAQFGTPLSSSGEEENITDRELPTPIESRVAALETQVTAIETQLADLPKIIHGTIARQMDSVITQVTQAVTRIIQKWIQTIRASLSA
ncbi:hypothetical protein HPB49_020595 [Dermacentor silvarum]|uniref:Uncharacterized protein n=1 Tax=Dermacentor silvarum TaxID=543639 RepID=A0ACB8DRA0_DERSI|nr:hypothetical protein HPB49_020595 [Dermacentor silvarum]